MTDNKNESVFIQTSDSKPLELSINEFTFDDHTIKVAHATKGIEVDMELLQKDNTGFKVWKVAEEFCKYLSKNQECLHDKVVVELGAGTGICGLLAAKYAKTVIITDGDPLVMPIIEKNIELNGLNNAFAFKLRWGDSVDYSNFKKQFPENIDVVIASEAMYHETHSVAFLNTVKQLFEGTGGMLVMAFAVRGRNILYLMHQHATKLGFKEVPTDYKFENDIRSANFAYRMLSVWKIPP
mmetsp:Transcript_7947/g.10922  ORF Transcript_7947/g.10922 Transcript_7947/m.10922 type:complete len:239 (-) Transcript_7947:1045-1761(-)